MRALAAALLLALGGCAHLRDAATLPAHAGAPPTAAEAHVIVAALMATQALASFDDALRGAASSDDVRAILARDQLALFPAAQAALAGREDDEARLLGARLALAWAEALLDLGAVFAGEAARLDAGGARAGGDELEAGGAEAERQRLRAHETQLRLLRDRVAALGSVAAEHAARGGELARALTAARPDDAAAWRAAALYHRLRRDWSAFDAAMERAVALAPNHLELVYLRGLEAGERLARRGAAASLFAAVLRREPAHVRARVQLTVAERHPIDARHQLERLRERSPYHALIVWAGARIEADSRAEEGTRLPGP